VLRAEQIVHVGRGSASNSAALPAGVRPKKLSARFRTHVMPRGSTFIPRDSAFFAFSQWQIKNLGYLVQKAGLDIYQSIGGAAHQLPRDAHDH